MERIYLKAGDIIGNEGYTDLKINENGELELFSTEGGQLDFYEEETDTHYNVYYDMDGTRETNPNWGKLYYEKYFLTLNETS